MAKKNRKDAGRARDRKWEQENQTLREFQQKAPHIKALLRKRGINLPFYDFLDSYPDEFQRIVKFAKESYPTLMDVHEVDERTLANLESHWADFGYGHLQQIFFDIDNDVADYGRNNLDANLNGAMFAFQAPDGNLCTAIFICKSVKSTVRHSHLKYALKIAGLCHEIGHVCDFEQGLNFDVASRRLNVIDAEIFAHLFALDLMAKRNLQHSFEMLADAMKDAANHQGYQGQVCTGVVKRMPEHKFVDWQSAVGLT